MAGRSERTCSTTREYLSNRPDLCRHSHAQDHGDRTRADCERLQVRGAGRVRSLLRFLVLDRGFGQLLSHGFSSRRSVWPGLLLRFLFLRPLVAKTARYFPFRSLGFLGQIRLGSSELHFCGLRAAASNPHEATRRFPRLQQPLRAGAEARRCSGNFPTLDVRTARSWSTEIAGVDLRSAPSPHRWQVKVYATRRRHSFGGCHKFSRPVTDMCEMMAPVKPCASKLKIVKLNPLSWR